MFCLSTLMGMLAYSTEELETTQSRHALAELELLLDQCITTLLARPQTVIDSMRAGILINEAWRSFRNPDCLDWSGTSRSLVKIASQVNSISRHRGLGFYQHDHLTLCYITTKFTDRGRPERDSARTSCFCRSDGDQATGKKACLPFCHGSASI